MSLQQREKCPEQKEEEKKKRLLVSPLCEKEGTRGQTSVYSIKLQYTMSKKGVTKGRMQGMKVGRLSSRARE